MEPTQTAPADSSPAIFEAPTDPAANLAWRTTGEIPAETTKPKEDSAPSKTASPGNPGETEPASATGTKQETAKQHPNAADRLDEILADLKRAGLSPAELKTFKREAAAAASSMATESPAKPAPELTAPVKPKQSDKNADGSDKYATWEAFEEARDKYYEDFADFKAKLAVAEDRQERAAEASQQTLKQKLTDAKARYGADTEATVGAAVRSIINDQGVAPVIKAMLNDSAVLVDVMYALGSKPEGLAEFVELAKSDAGKAIRKLVLLEREVEQELAKGQKSEVRSQETEASATERDEHGKFVSQTPPAKKKPPAPPPAEELTTRGSVSPDPIEAAVRRNDSGDHDAYRAFEAEENRRERATRRGA